MTTAADIEFQKWPSIPRLNRRIIVTEKIDGTNAAVVVYATAGRPEWEDGSSPEGSPHLRVTYVDDVAYYVAAQSRKKFIYPGKQTDNMGFAKWVWDNAHALTQLGDGHHHGEWYGSKIQCGYGYTDGERRFMLFNSERWNADTVPADLDHAGVVWSTVLYDGPWSDLAIKNEIFWLKHRGSRHVPGFMKPEGVVVFHTASNTTFKVLCENDEISKTEAGTKVPDA